MRPIHLIIENDPNYAGIPDTLKAILESGRFSENRQFLYNATNEISRDKNGFMAMLLSMPQDSSIIGETNFHEEDQLERMVLMLAGLMKAGKRVNLYSVVSNEKYADFYAAIKTLLAMPEAFVTPEEFAMSESTRHYYKQQFNTLFKQVFEFHKVYEINSSTESDDKRILFNYANGSFEAVATPAEAVAA